MNELLKKITSKMPKRYQQELKRIYFKRQIQRGKFDSDEVEYSLLDRWVSEGDWVIDVGANIGHYTKKLSDLAGKAGRVIAFEPIPDTFELLAANAARFSHRNVSLLNAAASNASSLQGMAIPKFNTGLDNYFMAQITKDSPSIEILCLSIDSLELPGPVSFVKIDAEGHDLQVLKGMESILIRDHPVMVIEENSQEVRAYLSNFGYSSSNTEESHNSVFT